MPSAPGVLAPDWVVLSQSIITYSTPSAPLAGTSRLHRTAAYTRCLRCAGAPRRPTSGSGLSLTIPSWHAVLYDHGEFDTDKFQNSCVDIGLRRDLNSSALPRLPQSVSRGARITRLQWFAHCYGLSGCSPPCTDLTGRPANGGFTSRLSTARSPSPSLDMTTASTGLLCWRGFHPLEWQLASLHQIRTSPTKAYGSHLGW